MNKTKRVSTPATAAPSPAKSRREAKRASASNKGAEAATAPAATPVKSADTGPLQGDLAASVSVLRAEPGIYTLHLGATGGEPRDVSGMSVPVTHVGGPYANGVAVEIVASYPQRGPWFGPGGGTAVINVPSGGGFIVVTSYGEPGQAVVRPAVDLRRLDRDEPATALAAAGPTASAGPSQQTVVIRELPTEILLHIERAGDRLFPGRGWVGALGRKLRIEGFSIRPLEGLLPADVEFKGFEPNGQETPWVTAGTLCGTRGRGLPLTGFAVRVVPHLSERFEAVYEGSFFNAGIVGPHRNGEPCRSAIGNDPLEAVNIRLIEKGAAREPRNPAGR